MVTLDRMEEQLFNIAAGQDKLWQSLGAVERKVDNLQQTVDVLRQSTLGLLIEEVRELRKDLLDTPRGRGKHGYRRDKLGTCDLVSEPHRRDHCGKAWRPLAARPAKQRRSKKAR
jgi:hypothetical protein